MPKWCNQGESLTGNVFLKNEAQVSKYLGLYSDADEPGEDATLATITELAVASNYARILLGNADWTESPQSVFTNLLKTFTAVGGSWTSPTGYFITDVASGTGGNLVSVETFSDGPYTVNDGWSVKVTPKVTIA